MSADVGLTHYLLLGALLFACGAAGVAVKRNAVGAFVGVGLMLAAAAVNFVAFAHFNPAFRAEGWAFALSVVVLAAAGAAVGVAVALAYARGHGTADVDAARDLRG
jgi:NADH-quinone oxidoreductase subunit K